MNKKPASSPQFEIIRELGSGAAGIVYEVREHQSPDKKYALKVLKNNAHSDTDSFIKEAELLSRLHHRNLVAVEGYSADGSVVSGGAKAPCFWMELIEGRPISDAAGAASPDDKARWLRESLEALDYIHSQGILHGDLKPGNILIDREGRARLLDFGFAHLRKESSAGVRLTLRGSLPYLSPESITGEQLPASDLFALGTVFYEAVSGLHPRQGAKSLQDLLSPHFIRLEKMKSGLKPRAARVIDRLIETDLANRFPSAKDALQALEQEAVTERAPVATPFHPFELIGRKESWRRAVDFAAEARSKGRGGLILLHGPAGVGRSRFLRELGFHFQLCGERVAESDWSFAEGPTLRIFPDTEQELLHHRGPLFRMIKSDGPNASTAIIEYCDDLIDEETRGFIASLVREDAVCDLRLGNLDASETETFLTQALGERPSPTWTARIHRQTLGNPSLLMHAARDLRDLGLSISAKPSERDLEKLSQPKSLEETLAGRLRRLSTRAREALQVVAASPVSLRLEDMADFAQNAPSEMAFELAELVAQGWLRTSAHQEFYEIANEPARHSILQSIDALKLGDLHRRWLLQWTSRPNAEDGRKTLAMADHSLQTGTAPERKEWLLAAANLHAQRCQERRTVSLLTRALAATLTPEEREAVLRRLANAYGNLEEFLHQRETQDRWFSEFSKTLTPFDHLKYWIASGIAAKNLGDFEDARGRLRRGIGLADANDPEHRTRLVRAHALLGLMALEEEDDAATARRELETAKAWAEQNSRGLAEILRYEAAIEARTQNWPRAREFLDQSRAICDRLAWAHGSFSALLEKGNLALRFGDVHTAEEAYTRALKTAEESRDEALLGRALHNRGLLDYRRGEIAGALDPLLRARELFLFFGGQEDRAINLYQIAVVEASLASFDAARRLFLEAESLSKTANALRRREEAIFLIAALETGAFPKDIPNPFSLEDTDPKNDPAWNLEHRWLRSLQKGDAKTLRTLLEGIHGRLPNALRVRFEDRPDYRHFVLNESKFELTKNTEDSMDLMKRLYDITRELLTSRNVDDVLSRILDAAMNLSKAERGFVLIQTDPAGGGEFEVRTSRNVTQDVLNGDEFRGSLTAVRQAIREGNPVVTDNALMDARFKTSESVQELDLKSILVLPLKTPEGILGGLYLDHRYQTDLFRGADLKMLEMFADQAALALQKAQMIESLRRSNDNLNRTVTEQSSEIVALKKEVTEQREALTHEYGEIIGRAPAMVEVLSLVDRLVDTTIPVWIFGESGTGKEMIARALHMKGPRSKKPFITENCSSLPETLLESELFGHKKGSFTHADRDKKGLLQHADGGTVFLDEIADMSPAMQSKMLRFLQEGEIRPLGSNEIIKVDVRVVSASNKDLHKLIEEGKFREDLFYRLNGITVPLPSLRDRIEDIPLLAEHFLEKIAKETKKGPYEIAPDALAMLTDYAWPGNVRELENTLRSACLFHYKNKLLPKSFHFKKALYGSRTDHLTASAPEPVQSAPGAGKHETKAELNLLLKALRDTNYHKSEAAKALGISRRYLYKQLTKYAVPLQRIEMKEFVERTIGHKR